MELFKNKHFLKKLSISLLYITLLFTGCVNNTDNPPAASNDDIGYTDRDILGAYWIPQATLVSDYSEHIFVERKTTIQLPGQYPNEDINDLKLSERRLSWISDTWALTNTSDTPFDVKFQYPLFMTYDGDFSIYSSEAQNVSITHGIPALTYQVHCYLGDVRDRYAYDEYYDFAFSEAPALNDQVTVVSVFQSPKDNVEITREFDNGVATFDMGPSIEIRDLSDGQRIYVYGGLGVSIKDSDSIENTKVISLSNCTEPQVATIIITGDYIGEYTIAKADGSIAEDSTVHVETSSMSAVLDKLIIEWFSPDNNGIDKSIRDYVFKVFDQWSRIGYPLREEKNGNERYSYVPFWNLYELTHILDGNDVAYESIDLVLFPNETIEVVCDVRLSSVTDLSFLPRTALSPSYGNFPLTVICDHSKARVFKSSLDINIKEPETTVMVDPEATNQYLLIKATG